MFRLLGGMGVLLSPQVLSLEVRSVQLVGTDLEAIWLGCALGLAVLVTISALLYALRVHFKLRNNLANMRAIWSVLPDTLTKVDSDGVVLAINHASPHAPQIDELIGTRYDAQLSDEGKRLFCQHLSYALTSGQMSQYEWTVDINGQARATHNRIVPLASSTQRNALIISTDVTHYKDGQSVLLQDKRQCERELKAKVQFLMNLSEEMRGPVALLCDVSAQVRAQENDTRPNQLHKLQASAEHFTKIINDIVAFTHQPISSTPQESINTSLWHIIDDLEVLYSQQATKLNIELQFTHDLLPHYIHVDAFRLRQMLYNIMSCHLSICENGALAFKIHQNKLAHEPVIQFTVTNHVDTNLADSWLALFNHTLDDEKINRLACASVTSFHVCKELVAHLQGSMTAKSLGHNKIEHCFTLPLNEVKHNDAFLCFKQSPIVLAIESDTYRAWFRVFFQSMQLPFLDVSHADIPNVMSLLVSDYNQSQDSQWFWWLGDEDTLLTRHDSMLQSPFRREMLYNRLIDYQASASDITGIQKTNRILLVEDNLNNQLVIKRTLEKLGYEVVVANNGEEGVAQFKASTIDCVIMDIQMPVMDGIEATRQIRLLDTPYVPVIALTANSQKEMEEACFAVGMDRFLTKPISRQMLQTTLEQFLGKQIPAHDSQWVHE